MRSNLLDSATLGLLAALASPIMAGDGPYFNMEMGGGPLVLERLDPLMSAGKVANHVHSVIGGNGFAPSMDFAQTQTSTCTTAPVKIDKSNYWMPSLYYKSPHNDSFIRVPERPEHKVYYKYGTSGYAHDLEQTEFPTEFRMISGNAMLRRDDGSHYNNGTQMNWQCHQPGYVTILGLKKGSDKDTDGSFPKGFTSCSDGLAATIRFPSCWNGQAFDPAKPMGHMAFPTNAAGLAGCEAPFNVKRFPEIAIEYWLDVTMFDGDYGANDNPWVLANGDPTGYGFHADFINGWKVGKLQAAMKTCNCGNGCGHSGLADDTCFGADAVDDLTCTVKPIVNEDVSGVLPHLPGCNPIQPGPQSATIQTDCAWSLPTGFTNGASTGSSTGADDVGGNTTTPAESASAVVSVASVSSANTSPSTMAKSVSSVAAVQPSSVSVVNQQAKNTPAMPIATATSQKASTTAAMGSPSESGTSTSSSTGSGSSPKTITASDGSAWSLMGCYTDQLNPSRSLGTTTEWWGQPITGSNCVDRCSKIGMSMSGTENAGQCFCGTSLLKSQKLDLSECDMPCEGDSSETCGGAAKLSVYKKAWSSHKRAHRHLARHLQAAS